MNETTMTLIGIGMTLVCLIVLALVETSEKRKGRQRWARQER